jgi:DNA-binding response OmpR family regulator
VRILVADDEPVTRALLQSLLRKLGHETIAAPDGEFAWTRFRMEHVPVVITDWRMPKMDGLELCRRIRADTRPRYTFVIVLTSVDGREGYLEGMKAGADDFMVKPPDAASLEARLYVAQRVLRLQDEFRTLSGLLPICSYCKRIREGQDYWQQVESFVAHRTEAQFSHSICPDCYAKHVEPELEAMRRRNAAGPGAAPPPA